MGGVVRQMQLIRATFELQLDSEICIKTKMSVRDLIIVLGVFLFHPADSHKEAYQEFQPSYKVVRKWYQGFFRPQVMCVPSLHFLCLYFHYGTIPHFWL